jgi:hypothetical protein
MMTNAVISHPSLASLGCPSTGSRLRLSKSGGTTQRSM